MRIKDLILPEDRIFFDLLDQMSEMIEKAAVLLGDITHDLAIGQVLYRDIRALEHDADGITRAAFERLNESLITPLEPEEIARLVPALDDVMDRIDRVAHQLATYGISGTNPTLEEFSRIIVHSSRELRRGTAALRTLNESGRMSEIQVEINLLWNESQDLISTSIPALFSSEDLLQVIKLKDIYEGMYDVIEKCKDFGHVLHDISRSHR